MCLCLCGNVREHRCPWIPEDGVGRPGAGVIGGHEPLTGVLGPDTGESSAGQHTFSTRE